MSITIFENLLNSTPLLEKDIKNVTEEKLINLYNNNNINISIPKIIHLIYFKERDLCNYHLRCINSMLKYMPDYKIIIYNDIEPINNSIWNELKQNNNIEIKYKERPSHFDDYKLNYVQYQADIVRLEILYEYGGIYLDLDILLIKNFDTIFTSNKDLYISKDSPNKDSGLINAFMAAKPKNEFIKIWLNKIKAGIRMNIWEYNISVTNKKLLEKNLHYKYKYNIEIIDYHHFFPIDWRDKHIYESIQPYNFKIDTYGVHLWDTILHDVLKYNKFFPNV